jgi:S1-C subfamily serine protease
VASSLSAFSADLAALVAGAAPRLVAIEGADGTAASGIIWRSGLAVSAHEALAGEDEFAVVFADGSRKKAAPAGRDPSTDVALFKVETAEFVDWAAAPTPAVGSLAVVAGRGDHSATAGIAIVSDVGPAWRSMRGGEIDARISLGILLSRRTEGGAVLSAEGGLIGMAVAGPRRRTLVIPTTTVGRAVATLAARGYMPRGYLGVSLHQLGEDGGAIIVGLEDKGPARQAGLLIGDIITTWGDDPIHSVADITHRLNAESVGRAMKLGVLRGGSPLHIDVAVGERPRA